MICNGILCFNNYCAYCNSTASKVLHYWSNIDVMFLCVVCHAINTTLAKITVDASVLEQVQWSYIQLPPIKNLVSYLPSYNRLYWSILSADRTMPHHHMPSTELILLHDLARQRPTYILVRLHEASRAHLQLLPMCKHYNHNWVTDWIPLGHLQRATCYPFSIFPR